MVRESTGFLEVYMGVLPKFHLFVLKDDAAAARDIVGLEAASDHVHIACCPKCGSSEVEDVGVLKNSQAGYFAQSLELCLAVTHRAIAELLRGPKYRCSQCQTEYRTNFRKPLG
ncbi:hypothetical protein [Pelagicoccus sp. SDUM812005]|uniref:hypothetical protein n=1 Tax=Pelagicoccus sp. SDUM812005 TaxID=3041257 RepID=UPI0028103184|nr:hypothetical protein [Pelagicoccus sp. SDUM812005]MDQ8183751.1 hypothetical protein [Pelagicoccus sp. SDUM812005]